MSYSSDLDCSERKMSKSGNYYRKLRQSSNLPNLCLICNQSFISSAALSQHLIGKHSEIDCFKCNHCGKTGKQKNNVRTFCKKKHPQVDFDVIRINENISEDFISKNSFKGTLEDYQSQIKKPKITYLKKPETNPSNTENNSKEYLIDNQTQLVSLDIKKVDELYIDPNIQLTEGNQIKLHLPKNLESKYHQFIFDRLKCCISEINLISSITK